MMNRYLWILPILYFRIFALHISTTSLEFPSSNPLRQSQASCKNRRSDLAEPLDIPTIHFLQRCTENCVIHIFRCMRHILPIRESKFSCASVPSRG
ncbi:hypothetical protein F5888DRAFT_1279707 [Russula emetica]|nr:hypothetical protein F5888DRAFT_1279707 [Russula emetica]